MKDKKNLQRARRKNRVRHKIKHSDKQRLSVFRSLTHIYCQIIDDTTGKTTASFSDMKIKKGTKKEKAKQVGLEIAKLALEKKVKEVIFDRNGYRYHGRVKELAEGAREGGLKF